MAIKITRFFETFGNGVMPGKNGGKLAGLKKNT
jgi:hypothetical protein